MSAARGIRWEMNERELGWLEGLRASGDKIEVYRIYDQASWSLACPMQSAYDVKLVNAADIAAVDLERRRVQLISDIAQETVNWEMPQVSVSLHHDLSALHRDGIRAMIQQYADGLVTFALEIEALEAQLDLQGDTVREAA